MNNLSLNSEYLELLKQIQTAQLKAAVAINHELISLYWCIGKQIMEKQRQSKWGSNFLESLSHNLQVAFPKTKGFLSTNLKRMRLFAEHYPELGIGKSAQAVHQLPWSHIIVLIHRVKTKQERAWYIEQVLANNWSRYTLEDAIKTNLYQLTKYQLIRIVLEALKPNLPSIEEIEAELSEYTGEQDVD